MPAPAPRTYNPSMKRTPSRTAAQTAALLCAGALLAGSSFFVPGLIYTRFEQANHFDRALFLLPVTLIGGFVMLRASMLFKRGIADGSFPEKDVEALRTAISSFPWRAAVVACGALWAVSLFGTGRFHLFGWAFYPLFLALNTIASHLNNPNNNLNAPLTIASSDPAPLTSDHWGPH
jgi:hypothetical protein